MKLKTEFERLGRDRLSSDVSKTALPFFASRGFKVERENINIREGLEIINFHMVR